MKLLLQIAVIFGICYLGSLLAPLMPFPFPASIAGMIILFTLLVCKIIKSAYIEEFSGFLVRNLAFFLVPNSIELMEHYQIIGRNFIAFITICTISTVIAFAAAGYTVRLITHLTTGGEKS